MMHKGRLLPTWIGVLVLGAGACVVRAPLNPKTVLHQQRGALLLANDQLDEAEAEFVLALEYNPRNPEAQNGLGLIAFRRGDLVRAAAHFRDALIQNDEFAEAHSNLGAVMLAWGDLQQATGCFRAALAIDPGYVNARYNLVLALRQQGARHQARTE
jgi:Flp pilus assembly protein TadD